jgi:caffeoyl-CoA O-methyltransferase
MEFIDKNIMEYAEMHTSHHSDLLEEVVRATHIRTLQPRMVSGYYQGRLLSFLSKMVCPKLILEIGTFTGFSALCLAEGLHPDGKIITIEVNEELEPLTRSFFDKSDFKNQIDFRIGDAKQIIPIIESKIDFVFIDAGKKDYIDYYNLIIDKMNPGGLIIADNILWSGKVLETNFDKETKIIDSFNKMVQADARVENILLPIRDGLMIARVL